MSLKKLGVALLAVLALGAIAASSASAAAEESNGFWYKESTKLTTAEPVTCAQVGEATLTTTVGKNNTPLKLKAAGTSCPGGEIFNEASKAKATGKIKFTGVTVVEPVGCSVEGGAVQTEALKAQVYMEGTKALVRFAPATGTQFAEVEITGCAIAGAYPTKGVVFGEAINPTNTLASAQNVKFSTTINSAAGGELLFGGHAAVITGETSVTLTGGGQFKANVS